MKTVHKSVLIWYSPAEMFALVTDVPHYPEFLPWCDQARIVETHADGVTAEVGISIGGLHQRFTTRNAHIDGQQVKLNLVSGPFSQLEGEWNFVALNTPGKAEAAAERACRVELELRYGFDNAALSMLVGPVFDKIAGSLVDAFVRRAEQVYG
ncbi:MAG: type II toxin-antitoxin system RatA family toxin [Pseudomonadota bacterium]